MPLSAINSGTLAISPIISSSINYRNLNYSIIFLKRKMRKSTQPKQFIANQLTYKLRLLATSRLSYHVEGRKNIRFLQQGTLCNRRRHKQIAGEKATLTKSTLICQKNYFHLELKRFFHSKQQVSIYSKSHRINSHFIFIYDCVLKKTSSYNNHF